MSTHDQLIADFGRTFALGRAETTVKIRLYYITRLRHWAEQRDHHLLTLTTRDLIDWLTGDVGQAPATKRSARHSLSVFYKWAVTFDHLTHDPTLRIPHTPAPPGVPHPTPAGALDRALTRCTRIIDVQMILLAHLAGLRCCEIAPLHTRAIEDEQIRVTGKGGHQRLIPLHPTLGTVLGLAPAGFVFPSNANPTGHMLPASIGQRIRDLHGNRHGHNAHSLRHKFGVDALTAIGDLMALRDLLGHRSVATTQIYTRAAVGRLRGMVNALTASPRTGDVLRGFTDRR